MATPFYMFPVAHDPDTREQWTFPFELPAGAAIASATVTPVDANDAPVVTVPPLVINTVTFAAIDPTASDFVARWGGILDPTKNNWGASFFAQGGLVDSRYILRARLFLVGNVSGIPDIDQSIYLRCEQK